MPNREGTAVRRPLLLLLALLGATTLLVGACSDDGGGDDESAAEDGGTDDSTAEGGSGDGDDADFCAVVEEQLPTATSQDLQAAIPAIEAMADAAPEELQDAFEENLATLEPVAEAEDEEAAAEAFLDEVATDPAYAESFEQIADGVQERCGIDVSGDA